MSVEELAELAQLKQVAEVYGWDADHPTFKKRLKAIQVKHTNLTLQGAKAVKKKKGRGDKRIAYDWVEQSWAKSWQLAKAELAKIWKVLISEIKPDRPGGGDTTIKKVSYKFRRFMVKGTNKVARIVEMNESMYVVQLGNEKVKDEEDECADDDDDDDDADNDEEEEEAEEGGEDGEAEEEAAPCRKAKPPPKAAAAAAAPAAAPAAAAPAAKSKASKRGAEVVAPPAVGGGGKRKRSAAQK